MKSGLNIETIKRSTYVLLFIHLSQVLSDYFLATPPGHINDILALIWSVMVHNRQKPFLPSIFTWCKAFYTRGNSSIN